MPSEARQKKIMEKLNRAQKCSILGPQNLGSGGGPGPRGPPPGSAPAIPFLGISTDSPQLFSRVQLSYFSGVVCLFVLMGKE